MKLRRDDEGAGVGLTAGDAAKVREAVGARRAEPQIVLGAPPCRYLSVRARARGREVTTTA